NRIDNFPPGKTVKAVGPEIRGLVPLNRSNIRWGLRPRVLGDGEVQMGLMPRQHRCRGHAEPDICTPAVSRSVDFNGLMVLRERSYQNNHAWELHHSYFKFNIS
ncbi:MAG: hypothetical protein ACLU38_04690, partial [Dysosmobacter sp.]